VEAPPHNSQPFESIDNFASIELPKTYIASKQNKQISNKMLISPIPFKLIHQPPLVLALSSLFINNNKSIYLGLHRKS
jgi:hypothetical protein